jgi:hypothetical protein
VHLAGPLGEGVQSPSHQLLAGIGLVRAALIVAEIDDITRLSPEQPRSRPGSPLPSRIRPQGHPRSTSAAGFLVAARRIRRPDPRLTPARSVRDE